MDIFSRINHNIKEILEKSKSIAVVGLSDSPVRPSNQVARYLVHAGYKIIPINPNYDVILGEKCFPDLKSVPEPIDIVNIFRNPEHVLPIVQEAVELNPGAIWMQLGVINESAAQLALDRGVELIMDRCIKIEHLHYF
jgi:predicted CoA-binding protein